MRVLLTMAAAVLMVGMSGCSAADGPAAPAPTSGSGSATTTKPPLIRPADNHSWLSVKDDKTGLSVPLPFLVTPHTEEGPPTQREYSVILGQRGAYLIATFIDRPADIDILQTMARAEAETLVEVGATDVVVSPAQQRPRNGLAAIEFTITYTDQNGVATKSWVTYATNGRGVVTVSALGRGAATEAEPSAALREYQRRMAEGLTGS